MGATDESENLASQSVLVKQLLDRVSKLETLSRQLLLDNLDHGVARTLLVADRNGMCHLLLIKAVLTTVVQARSIGGSRELAFAEASPTPLDRLISNRPAEAADEDDPEHSNSDDTLEDVERYRSLFAEILVLGSTLQHLEGQERATFERRLHDGEATAAGLKVEQNQVGDVEEQRELTELEPDGLTGLTKMLYRQHAKKLRRVYTD